MTSVSPGGTIGILGGGQLGRMLAMAAARLGLRTHIYCDHPGPACDVATHTTIGAFDDMTAVTTFARAVDVVTYEFENVPLATAAAAETCSPLRPATKALEVAQDRLTEKTFVAGLGLPVAPFAAVASEADLARAIAETGVPAILKTRRLGYDGKGQAPVSSPGEARAAWTAIGGAAAILEGRIAFASEVSVLVVRAMDGAIAYYDIPRNTHSGGILRRSIVPSSLPCADADQARDIARGIAEALDYVGVLAVEMFHLPGTAAPLVVNEIAPRVHNSGHWTLDACAVSQFENHIRAVAGWPLGATTRHSDAEMDNLIGPEANDWAALAAEPGACLHLYGKNEAREGRKMGHVTRVRVRTGTPS